MISREPFEQRHLQRVERRLAAGRRLLCLPTGFLRPARNETRRRNYDDEQRSGHNYTYFHDWVLPGFGPDDAITPTSGGGQCPTRTRQISPSTASAARKPEPSSSCQIDQCKPSCASS